MGWNFVRRRMAGELGPDWQNRFARFDQEAAAAASLGQVHRAQMLDGTEVACKLQYPDMPSTVDADLRQLRLAMSVYKRIDSVIQGEDIYTEIAERLREELDYQREAAQMKLYGTMLQDVPSITVPQPIESLTTKRLLTMTWLDGKALQKRIDEEPPLEVRNNIATAMFKAWYVPFYQYGVIHGDPHLGNYQVREDDGVNLLDFGAIRVFPARFVAGVIDLYEAVRDHDDAKARHAYEGWGFLNLSKEQMAVLNQWAEFVYEPLLDDRVRRIQENGDPTYGRSVVERVHAGLRQTGGVRPPREFVMMDPLRPGIGQRIPPVAGRSELVQAVPRADRRVPHGRRGRPGRRRHCWKPVCPSRPEPPTEGFRWTTRPARLPCRLHPRSHATAACAARPRCAPWYGKPGCMPTT